MLQIYMKHTKSEASKEELKWAHTQFFDIIKTLGITGILVLPFAPLTLPLIIKLGKKLGINMLPDSMK